MYIYILRCKDNSLYTGITKDILKRFKEHAGVLKGGAKYTRSRGVIRFESIWKSESDSCARKLEFALKKLVHRKKEEIVRNPEKLKEYLVNFKNEDIIFINPKEYNKKLENTIFNKMLD